MAQTMGLPFTRAVPIGAGATREFVQELAALAGVTPVPDESRLRLPWYSASIDSTYLKGKRVFVFGDGTHVAAAARIARDEMGFEVVGLGCYNREMARPIRALATDYGVEALMTNDHLDVEAKITELAPELILGTQMERHTAKRLGIPCTVISAPVHVQDFPARYAPQLGREGANVILDTWGHPLVMGLEENLLAMFREDFEFHDAAGPSHHGHGTAAHAGTGDAPESGTRKLLKKLRGRGKGGGADNGAKKMRMLRRLPRLLQLVPGRAQDMRAWLTTMRYWLTSDDNIEALARFLISRYCRHAAWRGHEAPAPLEYPDTGLYHPDLPDGITIDPAELPAGPAGAATVGLLMMRSYVLSGDTAHYDTAIRALEARGLRVMPAFAGGLDARPAIDAFFHDATGPRIDALLSLTGFSLVGGPADNDNDAAIRELGKLYVPYVAAHPLEFQTLAQWAASASGLGPIETIMLIALPELDGATTPAVFAGRHGDAPCGGCVHACSAAGAGNKAWPPAPSGSANLPRGSRRWPRCAAPGWPSAAWGSSFSGFRRMPAPPERPPISMFSPRFTKRCTRWPTAATT